MDNNDLTLQDILILIDIGLIGDKDYEVYYEEA